MKPQTKTVLNHLKSYQYITPAIARDTYDIWRLTPCVYELRHMGHKITTTLKRDAMGHRYAYYTLKAA